MTIFAATRAHGLQRLEKCIEVLRRNDWTLNPDGRGGAENGPAYDPGLTPFLRHRLVHEREVLAAIEGAVKERGSGRTGAPAQIDHSIYRYLGALAARRAWLDRRPGLFRQFLCDRLQLEEGGLRVPADQRAHEQAFAGRTGIACFDSWVGDMLQTGYLSRQEQRWFASIWIFTLTLPLSTGAGFLLRHLIDADVAEQLWLWRDVAGLSDGSRPYLVTSEEINAGSGGRFGRTPGLCEKAGAVSGLSDGPAQAAAFGTQGGGAAAGPGILIVTSDDVSPETWPIDGIEVCGVLLVEPLDLYQWHSDAVQGFKLATLDGAGRRAAAAFDCPVYRLGREVLEEARIGLDGLERGEAREWYRELDEPMLLAMRPPPGQGADDIAAVCSLLASIEQPPKLALIERAWDRVVATHVSDSGNPADWPTSALHEA